MRVSNAYQAPTRKPAFPAFWRCLTISHLRLRYCLSSSSDDARNPRKLTIRHMPNCTPRHIWRIKIRLRWSSVTTISRFASAYTSALLERAPQDLLSRFPRSTCAGAQSSRVAAVRPRVSYILSCLLYSILSEHQLSKNRLYDLSGPSLTGTPYGIQRMVTVDVDEIEALGEPSTIVVEPSV